MTIPETVQPAIGHEQRRLAFARAQFLLLPIVVLSATALTVVNLGATVYLYLAIKELRAVDQSLAQLETFEQRMVSRMDAMNTGVQGRLEGMSGDLQGQFHRINEGIAGMKSVPGPGDAHEDFPVELETEAPAEDPVLLDAPAVALKDIEQAVAAGPPATKEPAGLPPKVNPAYQRTQSADGKVYYRKVR